MRAASLFEVLIVIGIFSLMVVASFPYSLSLINQYRVESATKQIAFELFHQQQEAYSGKAGKNYGVAFYEDHLVSFVGTSLATAESTFTIPVESPIAITAISFSSGNEVTFLTGDLVPSGTGYLKVSDLSKTYKISINTEGLISYDVQ